MAKHDPIPNAPAPPVTPESNVTLPASALAELIAAQVRSEVARIMTAKTPDERMSEEMDRQRGRNRPAPYTEELVPCLSPLTEAKFTARLTFSKSFPRGRVAELIDYVRPDGWDRKKQDGGRYHDGEEWPLKNEKGDPARRFTAWVYEEFWKKDWNELSGNPLPPQYRLDHAPAPTVAPGSVVLTAEQLAALGITPDEIAAAISEKAAE
jgi:hypothetical protein